MTGHDVARALVAAALLAGWGAVAWRLTAGSTLAGRFHAARAERAALAYALAVAAILLTVAIPGRWLGIGFHGGALTSLACAAAIGLVLMLRAPALEPPGRDGADDEPLGAGWLALGNLPVAAIAALHHASDATVHFWNVAALQRGRLPLPYPSDPDLEVPYHYGVDLLAAVWGLLLPLHPEWIYDGLLLAGWNACALLAVPLVRGLCPMPRRRALGYTLAFGLLGGGATWGLLPWIESSAGRALAAAGWPVWLFEAGVWGHFVGFGEEIVNFPILHYFFNQPMTVGLPLGLAFCGVFAHGSRQRGRLSWMAAAVLLGSLAMGHVAVFFTVGAGAFGFAVLEAVSTPGTPGVAGRLRHSSLPGTLGLLIAATALGTLAGGVLAQPGGFVSGPSVLWGRGLRVPLLELPIYHLATFGIPGLLGCAGAVLGIQRRNGLAALLALVALAGFAVPHLAHYHAPIDTLKFLTLSALFLGLLAGSAAEALRARLSPRLGNFVIAALVAGSVAAPLLHSAARLATAPDYALRFARGSGPADGVGWQPTWRHTWPDDAAAADWLAANAGSDDWLLPLPLGAPDGLRVLARSGLFLALPRHDGYPGIALAPEAVASRERWLARALAFERGALCERAGLWLYVREDAVSPAVHERLASAERRGRIRSAFSAGPHGARRLIYRACPSPPPEGG